MVIIKPKNYFQDDGVEYGYYYDSIFFFYFLAATNIYTTTLKWIKSHEYLCKRDYSKGLDGNKHY